MTGTFASFNTALTALRYQRVALDVAGSNVANVSTEGYARRRVEAESVGAPAQPAMWSRHDDMGGGVRVLGLQRMTDELLESRARFEHGNQGYLDVRRSVLERLESGVGEPGDNGVSAALDEFRVAWHDLANDPGSGTARAQVLSRAESLADAVRTQARNVATEAGQQRSTLQTLVGEVNQVASDLAAANKSIASATLTGTDASSLLDARDRLAMRLAELTGATASQRADGGYDVSVGGVALVAGQDAGRFEIATGVAADGSADGNPVTFRVVTGATSTALATPPRGEAGGVADLLDVTLPGYTAGLDAVATQLADEFNAQHTAGYDRDGVAGVALFSYTPGAAASSLGVAVTDPDLVAASGVAGGNLDGSNAEAMPTASTAGDAYQRLVNGLGSEVASSRRLAGNQAALTRQVDNSREQLSGVNLDEEMVTMVQAQRAYEAASRLMTTVDSVLDTLINRTGLTR